MLISILDNYLVPYFSQTIALAQHWHGWHCSRPIDLTGFIKAVLVEQREPYAISR